MQTKEGVEILAERLDRIETKLDAVLEVIPAHTQQILHMQGAMKVIIAIVLAVSGFFATAFYGK